MTDIRFDFSSRTAIVTGAASGLGREIALEFGASGALVIVSDLKDEAGRVMVDEIMSAGGQARALTADVTDEDAVREMASFAERDCGGLHMAVNNAGIGGPSMPTGDYSFQDWRCVIDINLNGAFYGMRWQIPAMLRAGEGSIVNMSSIPGIGGLCQFRGLCRSQAWTSGADKDRRNGIRAARHPGECRGPGLYRHAPSVGQPDARGQGRPCRHAPDGAPRNAGRGIRPDMLPAVGPGEFHHRQLSSGGRRLTAP